jgi:pimeloyl-ACP methyl ester carboxylesterase
MLHGYPDDGRLFARVAAAFTMFRVFALDWPGQGESAWADDAATPSGRAAWLCAVLDTLGLSQTWLFGHDMGALPALCFARDHGDRCLGVVAANALLCNAGTTSMAIAVMRRARLYRLALPYLGRIVYRRCMASFLDQPADFALANELRGSFLRPDSLRALVKVCDGYERELPDAPATFRDVPHPVLLLWGSRAAHFGFDHAERTARALRRGEASKIEGGHWMVYERAAEVARAVERWARQVDAEQAHV